MASVGNIYGSIRMRTEEMKQDLDKAKRNIKGFTNS